MAAPLEIRNSATGKIVPALGSFLMAAIFGFYVVKGLSMGAPGGGVTMVALLTLGFAGLGLFIARGAFDTRVQVALDENGFRDRRAGDVLVPWKKVKSVRLAAGRGAAMLNFDLTEVPPDEIRYAPANLFGLLPFGRTTVHMEVSSLDMSGEEMVEAVRKFAPHVEVRR
ncbi:hypothetical protein [Mesorhizobium sp. M1E.F.Ca.ET.041.01.1.1]|nr:hypothetical protein [Mesorhizobium sp. M1E.F.Ca.ET.041.01.1.1]RWD78706.1 MAG: hypothetical protein EOS39_33085 [Mesorhizobium sp.]